VPDGDADAGENECDTDDSERSDPLVVDGRRQREADDRNEEEEQGESSEVRALDQAVPDGGGRRRADQRQEEQNRREPGTPDDCPVLPEKRRGNEERQAPEDELPGRHRERAVPEPRA
jgi:hypothetical protein